VRTGQLAREVRRRRNQHVWLAERTQSRCLVRAADDVDPDEATLACRDREHLAELAGGRGLHVCAMATSTREIRECERRGRVRECGRALLERDAAGER